MLLQCKQANSPSIVFKEPSKLDVIEENGVLRVVTDYNSTSYFIYKGQPMGYQFELLQNFANFLDVKLEVTANNKIQDKFEMIAENRVDLIAVNLTITKERKKHLLFTEPNSTTRQVLVQATNTPQNSNIETTIPILKSQLDLAGKTIHVQQNSTYAIRLKNLSDEIGDTIHIVEIDEGVEELIEKVAKGEIQYTVCDENVANVNKAYYDNLDISLPVSFPQNLAWALSKKDKDLKEVVDSWLVDFKKTKKYAVIYKKYFENSRTPKILDSDYFAIHSGNISPYDNFIKEYSQTIGWDWRLVASMMYQESRFNPTAKSWAGAFGLMQLMPNTANRFGVDPSSHPKMQIRAGILFIEWLDNLYEDIEDPIEKSKFVLASYNVGPGHVMDARKLAEKYGKDPNIWNANVAEFLLMKSHPEYYNDPVVKYGYCRGKETYKYVSDVVERFKHYKNLVN